ncbi:MAG TPA: hypothetical protein VKB53_03435, partial [Gammaproteobacteria bacterium]|nr:hypothetical protein [Gammaproteobacteria bacterium]
MRKLINIMMKFFLAHRRGWPIAANKLTVLIDNEELIERSASDKREPILLIDEKYITAELLRLSETDAYFSRSNVMGFLEQVTLRVAHRMCKVLSAEWDVPKALIVEATYFHLFTELCSIIPLRRLARMIARTAANKLVLIKLSSLDLQCFKLGAPTELEPLILCWALQQRGCRAYLLAKGPVNGPELPIKLFPWVFALPPAGPPLPKLFAKGRPIIAPDGVRGLDLLVKEIPGASFLMSSHRLGSFAIPACRSTGIGPSSHTECCIILQRESSTDFPSSISFSAPWPTEPLTF